MHVQRIVCSQCDSPYPSGCATVEDMTTNCSLQRLARISALVVLAALTLNTATASAQTALGSAVGFAVRAGGGDVYELHRHR